MLVNPIAVKAEATQETVLEVSICGYVLPHGQQVIVGAILDPDDKRIIISAYTQYGKTQAVALGILLYIQSNPRKGRVTFIAPTDKQTKILRGYIADAISKNVVLRNLVSTGKRGPANLNDELSKERITFKTGWEIITLTAYAGENEEDPAPGLMGFGGDIIVCDEGNLILNAIYRKRILRMLTAYPDAKFIILMNPWNKNHYTGSAISNPEFHYIHIPWMQGVDEGRVTEKFINEMREALTPVEFTVLYDSKFPGEVEDALFRYEWLERAQQLTVNLKSAYNIHSLDVAEHGVDRTVLTNACTDGDYIIVKGQEWIKVNNGDTMATADAVASKIPKGESLNVDSIGVGAGVHSRLVQLGHKANSIRVSQKPSSVEAEKRFSNSKAERWWKLREKLEHNKIKLPSGPEYQPLISQLSQMRYENKNGKTVIIDPSGKSPDYADSLMLLMVTETPKNKVCWVLGDT